jgi:hypothetical protein
MSATAGGQRRFCGPSVSATALVFVNGRFSHAANKAALLTVVPTTAERDVAEAVLAAAPFAPAELLYARVDLIEGSDARSLLLELELVEPSTFLSFATAQAVSRFAAAITAAASSPEP